MGITEQQRQERKNRLGSSDMPAVLGVKGAHGNAFDVWLEKTDRLIDDPKPPGWLDVGNYMEPGLLQYAADQLDDELIVGPTFVREDLHLGANVDAELVRRAEPVEAKHAGMHSPQLESWGEPGTDQVPERVIVQAHVHLICMSIAHRTIPQRCWVPFCKGGFSLALYEVPRNESLCDLIASASVNFWTQHVLADVPPPDVMPRHDIAKRIRPKPGEVVMLDDGVVREWIHRKEQQAIAKQLREFHETTILVAMGGAEFGEVPGLGSLHRRTITPTDGEPYRKLEFRADVKT